MNIKKRFNSEELKTEAVIWIILGPILLFQMILFGVGILLFIPVLLTYSAISLLLFLRTFNLGYLTKMILFLLLIVFIILIFFKGSVTLIFFTGVIIIIYLILLIVLMLNRYYKWKTTELFELAALPVKEVKNGYTGRPMPAGKLDYKWKEVISFSNLIRRNLIAVVYQENDKVVFGLNHSNFKLVTFDSKYDSGSWVSFDKSGHVSVHISSEDYQKYKDAYAFDQLCENMGVIFQEFFILHQAKKQKEIIKRLNFFRIN